uniref:Uncharacterized protein n=1 Tax=Alexandrium monilatum TaxID=311494 RepID=A0A7S4QBB4_9DINO
MVDLFDPRQLRHDLSRRMPESDAPQRPQEPGVLTKCAEEIRRWFWETALARLCTWRRAEGRTLGEDGHAADGCAADADRCSSGDQAAPSAPGRPAEGRCPGRDGAAGSCSGGRPWGRAPPAQPEAEDTSAAGPLHPPRRGTGVEAASPGDPSSSSSAGAPRPSSAPADSLPVGGFPARAICGHLGTGLRQLRQDFKIMFFLAFPAGSPFQERTTEGLFQWHYTRRWWLCLDGSTVVLAMMLVWDVVMNPPHRVPMVVLFYTAFAAGLMMRKLLLFGAPSPPRRRRIWHNVLLCAFFFGRCVVCQPLLVNLATEGSRPFRALQVEAFISVIGLGMTNLSMVFMQQMQTIDMLIFCLVNGVVFILWIIFVLRMPLTDALHTAYVGSIVVTAVCVRQQRDLEDIERRAFHLELLQARGSLVRTADQIATQASSQEIGISMRILRRARSVEHVHF